MPTHHFKITLTYEDGTICIYEQMATLRIVTSGIASTALVGYNREDAPNQILIERRS